MAALRPTTRQLTRHLRRLTTTTTSTPCTKAIPTRLSHPHTSPHPQFIQNSRIHTTPHLRDAKPSPPLPSGIPASKIYTFNDIQTLSSHPHPNKILIDVREPAELLSTGRIPHALNIPIQSAPDSFFLSAEDFEDKYGFARPGEKDEVVFYCKAGVRSRAAARLAGQAGFGGVQGEFPGSWVEWVEKGGEVQKD